MEPAHLEANIAELVAGRTDQTTLAQLPHPPADESEAYEIQTAVTQRRGQEIVGWKIGATSAFAQEYLSCDGPFAGPVFAGTVHHDGAELPVAGLHNPMAEPEIALTLGHGLLAAKGPFSANDIEAAVASARPSIELVGGCFPDISTCGYRSVIADQGANQGLVLGAERTDWRELDLDTVNCSFVIDGTELASGPGSAALGGPLVALGWLADHLSNRGIDLLAGQVVSTGTIAGVTPLQSGTSVKAEYGRFGSLDFTVT